MREGPTERPQTIYAASAYKSEGVPELEADIAKATPTIRHDAAQNLETPTEDIVPQTDEKRDSIVTPEEDAAYMDAVNRGDMETARRMVCEAADDAWGN